LEIAWPRPEFGSTFLSSNWAFDHARSFSITGPLCSWWNWRRSFGDRLCSRACSS
jgi:hypothetical protein